MQLAILTILMMDGFIIFATWYSQRSLSKLPPIKLLLYFLLPPVSWYLIFKESVATAGVAHQNKGALSLAIIFIIFVCLACYQGLLGTAAVNLRYRDNLFIFMLLMWFLAPANLLLVNSMPKAR
jgi:hypothetical protein